MAQKPVVDIKLVVEHHHRSYLERGMGLARDRGGELCVYAAMIPIKLWQL